jgi:hypothetical protein
MIFGRRIRLSIWLKECREGEIRSEKWIVSSPVSCGSLAWSPVSEGPIEMDRFVSSFACGSCLVSV